MTVGLIDVDGHNFPNLALMKISAWHKAQGDNVEMCFPLRRYDRVYASKVFDATYSRDIDFTPMTDDFRKGGTGYGLDNKLPFEIEHTMPDYSLYGVKDMAYGFLSRGCPRGCDFCIVSRKEGRASQKVADLKEFWNCQKNIKLLDPNITACPEWRDLFGQLIDSKAWIDFTQGIDIRMLTDEKVEMLNKMKIKMLHFAWDKDEDLEPIFKKWAAAINKRSRDKRVYMLTNYGTSLEFDLHRIYTIRDLGYDPYVMIYDKPHAPRKLRLLQRWVNNKFVFYKTEKFEDYNERIA